MSRQQPLKLFKVKCPLVSDELEDCSTVLDVQQRNI